MGITAREPFTCQNCGKQVTSENDKRAHTSEHISYLAHQCETCDKTFQTKPHRLKHVMSQEVPAKIRQWLENIAPVRRYGTKLLKDCSETRTGLPKVGEVVVSEHKKKVDWERKLVMKELEEKEDTLANLVTYQSDLVSREWHSADGMTAPVYRQPGLGDGMKCESVNSAYSKAILGESEQPPVHVRDKVGGPSPGESSTGAPGSSPFPPTVASPALAPTPTPPLQPALPQSPVPQQPQAGLPKAGTSVAPTTPAPTAQAVVVGISQPLQQVGQQTILQNYVRSMTKPEIKTLLAKQPIKVGQGGVVTVPANAGSNVSAALAGQGQNIYFHILPNQLQK